MNTERLFKTVMIDLSSSLTKYEDELERTINADISLSEKAQKVKFLLLKITNYEASITKFSSMMTPMNNEQNNNPI